MDKIQKALQKFSTKERVAVILALEKLRDNRLQGMDIVKLKGHSKIFRLRHGSIRIIFRLEVEDLVVLAIERRSEKTYKGF